MNPTTTGGLIDLACQNADSLKYVAGLAAVHFGCKAITILTAAPDPNTKLGKFYKLIETLALVVGKVKQ